MPIQDWMRLVNLPLWRNRLQLDYLANVPAYRAEFVKTVHEMGYTGSSWQIN